VERVPAFGNPVPVSRPEPAFPDGESPAPDARTDFHAAEGSLRGFSSVRLAFEGFRLFRRSLFRRAGSAWFSAASSASFLFRRRTAFAGVLLALAGLAGFGSLGLFREGMGMKGRVLGVSQEGYGYLSSAVDDARARRFDRSAAGFERAYDSFSEASAMFEEWNSLLVDLSRFIPGASKLSSGKNAVEAGKRVALAGRHLNGVLEALSSVKNPLSGESEMSLLELFRKVERGVAAASSELAAAREALEKVRIEDIPEDKRDKFVQAKARLPQALEGMDALVENGHLFSELLGGNGPRKYLFLFQNNHEMRATGGFIGSYGLVDVSSDGRIRNFFVDGIFNPDGQLKEDIVPPSPIQKVSAAWSLHDSNWFPDFPVSAEKAVFFYEKSGGPTVDGVITLTPTVVQKLLRLTGPIPMEKYGATLDADNFMERVQYEVEVDYDKEENRPKQILADLAPVLMDRLLNASDMRTAAGTLEVFEEGLREKHILFYSRNREIQALIDRLGWSGRILDAPRDYLSVVNSNVNGYKTDGVIEEKIEHRAEIREDGSVVDTVAVTRRHTGGFKDHEWWNRVNADYMRVYVPKGSRLLSVEGQTREIVDPPVDYDRLGFRRDADVEAQEKNAVLDESTGTRIYEESGKTVFGNWVYVSPQETVTIRYTYLLPFKVRPKTDDAEGEPYAVVYQKQSGSVGSSLHSNIAFPHGVRPVWQPSENLVPYDGGLTYDGDLKLDRFLEVSFEESPRTE
jgi:hypothetical protein